MQRTTLAFACDHPDRVMHPVFDRRRRSVIARWRRHRAGAHAGAPAVAHFGMRSYQLRPDTGPGRVHVESSA